MIVVVVTWLYAFVKTHRTISTPHPEKSEFYCMQISNKFLNAKITVTREEGRVAEEEVTS